MAIFRYSLLAIPLIGAYALFAMGISVIYRASRVLNLAHGAMAMVPAYLTYSLVQAHVPMPLALVLGVVSGAVIGIGVERLFVRRLRPQGPTAQTVGTVAVTGLLIALVAKIWGSNSLVAPVVFPEGHVAVGKGGIKYGDIGLFLVAVVVSLALFTFFKRTQLGLALRAAAQNRRAAALMGVDPDVAAGAAWALGGALAALGGILLASVQNLDPYNLSLQVLPAFVAALIGGIENLRGVLMGSAIAGLAFGLVPYFSGTPVIGNVVRISGSAQLVLALLTLIVLALRGRRISGAEQSESGLASTASVVGRPRRRRSPMMLAALAVFLVLWPLIVPFSLLGNTLVAIRFGLIAVSLVVMTGWVGQISLAQASFVGVAALVTGMVVRGTGFGFPISMVVAALAAGAASTVLGVVALRVRGLYLAVATLVFAWMCDAFLFRSPWLGAGGGSSTIPGQRLGTARGFPSFDLTNRRTLYYLFAIVLILVVVGLANLRDTKTGRAFFAVRGSEMAAASLGIDVVRTKLAAFALSGALAGIAGNMLMIGQRTIVPSQFLFTISLQYLAIAVVGGLGSLGGALAAGGLFAALNELFYRVTALSGWLEVVSAMLLTVVLLAYPGGLAQLFTRIAALTDRLGNVLRRPALKPRSHEAPSATGDVLLPVDSPNGRARHRIAERTRWRPRSVERRAPAVEAREAAPSGDDWLTAAFRSAAREDSKAEPAQPVHETNGHRRVLPALSELKLTKNDSDANALEVTNVTVRFGGLTAVSDASLAVRDGTITALIGPNGAGKTTLFNAILGLNDPSAGRIELRGQDATRLPPHLRARLGVARTFQVLQLFNELTVFDNLLVATHLHNESGIWSNMAAAARTLEAERHARARVDEILRLLQLEELADRPVRGLPFGVLRMVELGRALVTGARLVMLDEPASGLNETETDKLSDVIRAMRGLGVSVLLIEHDIRMVTGLCDYIYVLDRGSIIAQGDPASIQRDPHVIAAYLGEPEEEEVKV
jgi:sulfate-transporting ATPase